jgi:Tol biopolymer transport system component
MNRYVTQVIRTVFLFVAISGLAGSQAEDLPLAEDEKRIFLTATDGSQMKLLADLPKFINQGSPNWSADGKLIAFDAHQAGQTTNDTQIIVVNADGTNPRVLCDGAMPSFSPRSHRIAFSRYGGQNRGVWVMSEEGPEKELVLLDENGWGADWSPDGTRIAYEKYTGRGANFAIFDLIEGTSTYLFPEGAEPYQSLFWNFMWSPDSKQIAFKGMNANRQIEVGIVDARGSQHGLTTRLVEKTLSANFAWKPDGSRLLVSFQCPERGNREQIYWLDPRTQDPPQLLPGQNPDLVNWGISWSPEGERLAIAVRRPKTKAK